MSKGNSVWAAIDKNGVYIYPGYLVRIEGRRDALQRVSYIEIGDVNGNDNVVIEIPFYRFMNAIHKNYISREEAERLDPRFVIVKTETSKSSFPATYAEVDLELSPRRDRTKPYYQSHTDSFYFDKDEGKVVTKKVYGY